MKTPEHIARERIDAVLEAACWVIQDMKDFMLGHEPGILTRVLG